jgi:cystathionine gamma-synthase
LPTWKANVGYEEGEEWVVDRMTTGYPRFFVHRSIEQFAQEIVSRFASEFQVGATGGHGLRALLFPTKEIASRCLALIKTRAAVAVAAGSFSADVLLRTRLVTLTLDMSQPEARHLVKLNPVISAAICSDAAYPFAREYWQHTGDGISSRRAEFCHGLLKEGLLTIEEAQSQLGTDTAPSKPAGVLPSPQEAAKPCRGPRRYQRPTSSRDDDTARRPSLSDSFQVKHGPAVRPATQDGNHSDDELRDLAVDGEPRSGAARGPQVDLRESGRFMEERFGRNLDLTFVEPAKAAIRRRVATAMSSHGHPGRMVGEDDIFLYPCGMNAIYNAHRTLLAARGAYKSINFGFPYVDTLKILQKFGPGCVFYGRASEADLDHLQSRLQQGERFLALFCEFPGNPLLTCPNLVRIRSLADQYDFAVVVDETIGTFANINVLPYADIVVSSLTKIFSGDCNVMGGSAVLNPKGRYYADLGEVMHRQNQDTYWAEDVIFMERNSRDFSGRIDRINANAEALCDQLTSSAIVKHVYYPKVNESRANYERCKRPTGGYGGLLSVLFRDQATAMVFYDALQTAKGPSLGTNFTLTSPYVVLAHYNELEWAAGLGVAPDLIRISVGLEDTDHLVRIFQEALQVATAGSA